MTLTELRAELSAINDGLLDLLNRRGRVVQQIGARKRQDGVPAFLPEREQEMLVELVRKNSGPFPDDTIKRLFKEVFRASLALMENEEERALQVSRARRPEDLVIATGDRRIGAEPVIIAGPCAVESEEQMDAVARGLSALGLRFLRGGTFKPRSSPYSFQGLGEPGLEILRRAGARYDMVTVTEVMDTRAVSLVAEYVDIMQIGARNMHNYPLLREVGRTRKPVLLKRGFGATIDELLWSAEYIVAEGNDQVIFCERGIRTFERQVRYTLDISAVPLLRQSSFLPVIVDVSHAAGRKDILAPLARAALAAGANGLMVEVHPCPAVARSDSEQQLDLDELAAFLTEIGWRQPEPNRAQVPSGGA